MSISRSFSPVTSAKVISNTETLVVQRAEKEPSKQWCKHPPPQVTRKVPAIFNFICTHMVPPLSAHNPTAAVMNGNKGVIQGGGKWQMKVRLCLLRRLAAITKLRQPSNTSTHTQFRSSSSGEISSQPFCPRVSSTSELTSFVFLVVTSVEKGVSVFQEGCGNQLFPSSS